MRIRLLLAYDGTGYSGWQIQEKPAAPPTVQGAVEAALFTLFNARIRIHGSGRTDAGVHAWGQVAHFDICGRPMPQDLRHSLNAVLPHDIRILDARQTDDGFDARKSAISKTYVYQFWQEPAFMPPHLRLYAWQCGPLAYGPMLEAAQTLVGEHDFAAFQNSGTPVRDTCRRVLGMDITPQPQLPYHPAHLPMLSLAIKATGFLKQMARNIAGCLYYVGLGKLEPGLVPQILAGASRSGLRAPTAPARGLALAQVDYGEGEASSPTTNARG